MNFMIKAHSATHTPSITLLNISTSFVKAVKLYDKDKNSAALAHITTLSQKIIETPWIISNSECKNLPKLIILLKGFQNSPCNVNIKNPLKTLLSD